MLCCLVALGPVARCRQFPVLMLNGRGFCEPPLLRPSHVRIAPLPLLPQLVPTVECGDQVRQIVGFDGLVVVGVELVTVVVSMQEHDPLGALALAEDEYRCFG